MFGVVGGVLVVAVVAITINRFKIVSLRWREKKTHPQISKTVSGHFIRVVKSSVLDEYKLSKVVLGKGASGVCHIGTHSKTRKKFAVKLIDIKDEKIAQFYRREIEILKDLEHLNIIRVFEAYEQADSLGLVMELCEGGHLGEVISDTPKGRLDEAHAQRYVCQLVGAIAHCHQHGICHRDIKLQNVLLETRTYDAQVKLIDFGNAKRFSLIGDRTPFKTLAGTTYTMAPEVFKKEYDERCDVWSLGVVAFIMLCGQKPFESLDIPNHSEVSKSSLVSNIMMGRFSFQHPAWEFISEDAMLFIMACFTMKYQNRPSSSQLFKFNWCSPHNINNKLPDSKRKAYTRKLSRAPSQSLSQTSMIAVAFTMSTTDHVDLRSLFQDIDVDGSGMVDRKEFCQFMRMTEPNTTEDDANVIFDAIDQDNNQEISFLEFVASMIDSRNVNVNEINQAFNLLDKEGKGYISHKDLFRMLATKGGSSLLPSPHSSAESSAPGKLKWSSSLLSLPSFVNKGTEKQASEIAPCEENRRKSHEDAIGNLIIPKFETKEMEAARLEKLQHKVKQIIEEADQDGDGKISYAEFLLAMASSNNPVIENGKDGKLGRSVSEEQKSAIFENYDPKFVLQSLSGESVQN